MTKFRSWLTWHWLCRWGKILRCLHLLELPPAAGSLENPLYFLEAENQTGYYSHPIRSWEEENWRWNCTPSLLNRQLRFLQYFLVGRKRECVRWIVSRGKSWALQPFLKFLCHFSESEPTVSLSTWPPLNEVRLALWHTTDWTPGRVWLNDKTPLIAGILDIFANEVFVILFAPGELKGLNLLFKQD
jgi:hypothetical protein